ncbi:hypothetical protein QUF72_01690 [Desulfobacterales bacterium HSG2]|nr:hypothetical protein [Desulfobacterales bacterium HSG2]
MIDECSSAKSCKEAALDRFKDAFALYEKKRYLAVVYRKEVLTCPTYLKQI